MIVDIPENDKIMLHRLLAQWSQKRYRNTLRTTYYEGKQAFRDFGISIPPQLRSFEPTLGWVAKGVDALIDRTHFEGFVTPVRTISVWLRLCLTTILSLSCRRRFRHLRCIRARS